ncbi:MAG: hypothetical protein M3380_02495, partial [Chloroflexota bacterium]|nr:hypothetical protein [Chloroflexota bacterium]
MKLWLPIRAELVCLQSALRAPLLVLLLALGGVGVAAYRVPFSYTLDIGGTPGGRIYDRPFLHAGFNYVGGEPESDSPARAFRWAFEDARLVFPGVGRAVRMARLRVAAAHPGPDPVPSGWQIGPTPLAVVPLARGPRVYHLLLPAAGPDLDLRLHTPTFQPPNDPRALGFAADAFSFRSVTPTLPAAAPLGWLAGCLVAGYLLVRRWGLP